jgi:hypothetical protein
MYWILLGVAAVLVGNHVCNRGLKACRDQKYGSLEDRRGDIAVSIGTVIAVVGIVLVCIGVIDWANL